MNKMNDGGSADYYKLPEGVTDLQDLIEYKDMGFSLGNIFKAAYRLNDNTHSDRNRDLRKIIWFAERQLAKEETGNKTLYIDGKKVEFSPEDNEYARGYFGDKVTGDICKPEIRGNIEHALQNMILGIIKLRDNSYREKVTGSDLHRIIARWDKERGDDWFTQTRRGDNK